MRANALPSRGQGRNDRERDRQSRSGGEKQRIGDRRRMRHASTPIAPQPSSVCGQRLRSASANGTA